MRNIFRLQVTYLCEIRISVVPQAEGTKLVIVKAKSNAVIPTVVKANNKNLPISASNEIPNHMDLPTIDNLPPSITEVRRSIDPIIIL